MSSLLQLFLGFGAVGPLPSIVLYLFFPGETVEYFNGDPSPTANFWCSVNASEDAMISFLCWTAFFSKSAEIKQLVVRTFGLYAVFHWGSCWWWSAHGTPHPPILAYSYPFSIGLSLAATFWWGFFKPPQDQGVEYQGAHFESVPEVSSKAHSHKKQLVHHSAY